MDNLLDDLGNVVSRASVLTAEMNVKKMTKGESREDGNNAARLNQLLADIRQKLRDRYGMTPVPVKDLGDFVQRAAFAPGDLKAMGIISGEAGGFMVPTGMAARLYQADPLASWIRSRALVIPPGDVPDAEVDIPAARQGANPNVITFSVANEGTAGTVNDPKLDLVTLVPQRLSANVVCGNSLLRNSSSFSLWFEPAFRAAKAATEEQYFLTGSGAAGQPLGMLNSPAALSVGRGTASMITYNDIANMMLKVYGFTESIWICSQSALGQILQFKDSIGAAGEQLTLMTRPLFWSSRLSALGTKGDLMLVNPALYAIKDGSGPYIDSSPFTATNFIQDLTTLRCSFFLDGQPLLKGALTQEDGTVLSPYVVLS